jgi:hypothetical protein
VHSLLIAGASFHQLTQSEMADDGNCQFRAISQQLFGTQACRRRACDAVATRLRLRRGCDAESSTPQRHQRR